MCVIFKFMNCTRKWS